MNRVLPIALFSILGAWRIMAADPLQVAVTCALPNNCQIWPLPAPASPDFIDAEFVSVQPLLVVRAGDWNQTTSRAVYRITGPAGSFKGNEVSFIFVDSFPTPESGIVLRKLDCPFLPSTKARFWIKKRGDQAIWDIQTYEISNEHFHRKPGA